MNLAHSDYQLIYSGCQKYESSPIFVKKLAIDYILNFKVPKHAFLVLKYVDLVLKHVHYALRLLPTFSLYFFYHIFWQH